MHTSFVGKVASMPSKYDEQTRARAVRLVTEHVEDYESEWAAIRAVAARLGMTTETLRRWVRQAQVDAGEAEGTSTAAAREVRELRRKNVELERTIEVLKAATSFFARESDPRPQ
jgi:transposase